jgi:cell division protein DivIC
MKPLSTLRRLFPPFLRNIYGFVGVSFLIWMLFFDTNTLFSQWQLSRDNDRLQNKLTQYQQEIKIVEQDLNELKNNTSLIEKVARENFYMKKNNEDVFIIESQPNK